MTAAGRWALWRGRRGVRCGLVRWMRRGKLRMVCGALVAASAVCLLPPGLGLDEYWPKDFAWWVLSPYRELPDAEALAILDRLGVNVDELKLSESLPQLQEGAN